MVDTNAVDFINYKPQKPEVYACKCPECGTLHHPAPMICKDCHARRNPSGVLLPAWEKVPLGGSKRARGKMRNSAYTDRAGPGK